jgi:hypothetical protein
MIACRMPFAPVPLCAGVRSKSLVRAVVRCFVALALSGLAYGFLEAIWSAAARRRWLMGSKILNCATSPPGATVKRSYPTALLVRCALKDGRDSNPLRIGSFGKCGIGASNNCSCVVVLKSSTNLVFNSRRSSGVYMNSSFLRGLWGSGSNSRFHARWFARVSHAACLAEGIQMRLLGWSGITPKMPCARSFRSLTSD